MTTTVARVGARVLLFDADGRVLLIHERLDDPRRTHWLTPGGGVEADEDLWVAAARELAEETGVVLIFSPDAPVVHRERRTWSWRGTVYDQVDHYFTATVAVGTAVTPTALTEMERQTLLGFAWWTSGELRASDETFVPPSIADIAVRVWDGRG